MDSYEDDRLVSDPTGNSLPDLSLSYLNPLGVPEEAEIQSILLADQLQRNPFLDNILVRQKDTLIKRIDCARPEDIKGIRLSLSVLEELWSACNYTYKFQELRERLRIRITSFRKTPNE